MSHPPKSLLTATKKSRPFYSRHQLRELAASAATIDERLSDLFEPLPATSADKDAAKKRLAAWCRSAASGDWSLMAKRLQRDNMTLESVMPRLASVQLAANKETPNWVHDAAWIVPKMVETACSDSAKFIRRCGPTQPFEDLFLSVIVEAERRRDQTLPLGAHARMSSAAHGSMAHQLLRSVTELCAAALYERFRIDEPQDWRDPNDTRTPSAKIAETPTRHYNNFISETRRSGLRRMFDDKPVLLRLLATVTRQWIKVTAEFLSRFHTDFDLVHHELLSRTTSGLVDAVDMGLSDLHRSGRSVFVVHFCDGDKILYKPKDVAIDVAWYELLRWLNKRNPPIDLRTVSVLARPNYGWTEYIEYQDCPNQDAAGRFFERSGALLSLFHLLVGTDMHEENMIAEGEYPVPIDLEMLLQASDPNILKGKPATRALEATQLKLANSVLSIGLLPGFARTPETAVLSSGGLSDNIKSARPKTVWKRVNTDEMTPERIQGQDRRLPNLPHLNGSKLKLSDYADRFSFGCDNYFHFMRGLSSELLSKKGPLFGFKSVLVRRVLRPTRFYWLLSERLRNRHDMCDGAIWSAHLDFISRFADWTTENDRMWPLFAAEREALAELNIPFFVHDVDGKYINDGSRTVAEDAGLSGGLQEARRRIELLDEEEIAWQCEVVRLTTARVISTNAFENSIPVMHRSVQSSDRLNLLNREMALNWANRIADRLVKRSTRDGDGAAWIGLSPFAGGDGYELSALGHDLYCGAPGVSVFLAAHAMVTGSTVSQDVALAGVAATRHLINETGAGHFARIMGLGGATGVGSVIYAFLSIGRFIGNEDLLHDARRVARIVTDDMIADDRVYDVVGGAAGCVLSLLALNRQTGDEFALNRAIACGNHLLQTRSEEGVGRVQHHVSKHPLTGFAHGAAGYAYGLSSLARATGDDAFGMAAQDYLDYERSLFSPKQGNWPDLREFGDGSQPHWPCRWCHGAAGIGLARLGMQRYGTADDHTQAEINAAVAAVCSRPVSPIDHLCCGNFGNVELLSEAARTTGRQEWATEASCRAGEIARSAQRAGHFGWNVGSDDENLGLFRGMAGVGYSFLRIAAPEALPNVLIWE